MSRSIASVALALVLVGALLVVSRGWPASAASTFTVNSTADTLDNSCTEDSGGCTLPDAIAAANATGGADTIDFDPSVFPANDSGPAIELNTTLPTVNATDGVTIDGSGRGVRIHSPDNNQSALNIQSGNGTPAQNVTIKHLRFTGIFFTGIVVCGGLISMTADPGCHEGISNITIQDSTVEYSGVTDITFQGSSASHLAALNNTLPFGYLAGIQVNIAGQGSNIEIAGNNISSGISGGITMSVLGQASNISIHDNNINGGYWGIYYGTVGGHNNSISHNTIRNAPYYSGISVIALNGYEDTHVKISRNSIYGNAHLGIDLEDNGVTPNDPGDADFGGNDLLNFPEITSADAQHVTGTACANCTVELFFSDNDPSGHGEGQAFLNDATASAGGDFSISICALGLAPPASVTATATDSIGNTSEFSLNFPLSVASGSCPTPSPTPTRTPSPTPTSTPTPTAAPNQHTQGDLDCSGSINGKDALRPLRSDAGVPQDRPNGCPPLELGSPAFADVTCDGSINAGDSIAIIEYAAGLPILPAQHGPCTSLGAVLS